MEDLQGFIQWLIGILVLLGGLYALIKKTKAEEDIARTSVSRSAIADLEVLNKRQAADLEEYRRDVAKLERQMLDFEREQTKAADVYEKRISTLEAENKELRELVTKLNEQIVSLQVALKTARDGNP